MRQRLDGSVLVEPFVAEKLEPVRMDVAVKQLGRTLAHAFVSVATLEAAMVEEETQQVQIAAGNLAAQKEVIPKAAIEILDDGTGPRRLGHHLADGDLDIGKRRVEFLTQVCPALPVGRTVLIQSL